MIWSHETERERRWEKVGGKLKLKESSSHIFQSMNSKLIHLALFWGWGLARLNSCVVVAKGCHKYMHLKLESEEKPLFICKSSGICLWSKFNPTTLLLYPHSNLYKCCSNFALLLGLVFHHQQLPKSCPSSLTVYAQLIIKVILNLVFRNKY